MEIKNKGKGLVYQFLTQDTSQICEYKRKTIY